MSGPPWLAAAFLLACPNVCCPLKSMVCMLKELSKLTPYEKALFYGAGDLSSSKSSSSSTYRRFREFSRTCLICLPDTSYSLIHSAGSTLLFFSRWVVLWLIVFPSSFDLSKEAWSFVFSFVSATSFYTSLLWIFIFKIFSGVLATPESRL